jgi:hypothetical protein
MKGVIQPDHMPVNRYQLLVLGMIPITCTEISGIEDELQTAEMPDRTVVSGGNRAAFEFTIMVPMHHAAEQAALELWFRESQDPVLPTYKKTVTLVHERVSGANFRSFTLSGVFPKKRALPDLEMANEGEMAQVEWTLSGDDIIPI